MSEAARIPFSETKAPESPERLHRGALRLVDISASTMANIGPAYSFFFGFAFLVVTAGVAAPLTIIVAMVAILFLSNTLAEFSKYRPSTGSFVTFIGMAFGPSAGAAASLFTVVGYFIAAAAIVAISGGWATPRAISPMRSAASATRPTGSMAF